MIILCWVLMVTVRVTYQWTSYFGCLFVSGITNILLFKCPLLRPSLPPCTLPLPLNTRFKPFHQSGCTIILTSEMTSILVNPCQLSVVPSASARSVKVSSPCPEMLTWASPSPAVAASCQQQDCRTQRQDLVLCVQDNSKHRDLLKKSAF